MPKLIVNADFDSFIFSGDADVMSCAVKEWEEWCESPVRDEHALLKVHGCLDTAKREPVSMSILMSEIKWVRLEE